MNILSLFSGVGGFDLGLEAAGHRTIYQCEWDKHATNILNRHWPDVPKWGDITTLTAAEILSHGTPPDIVAWGSPCQDLSVAGKRAGLAGARSGLFHEGIRIIRELREATDGRYPRISVWENVAGALSSNRGADFGVILDEMAAAGALVQEWRLLDAQYFGVPQRRRRVFLVSVFDPATADRCPDPLLPVSEGVRWHPSTRPTTRQDPPGEAATSFGSGRDIANTISAELYHRGTVVNQDANNGHLVINNHARPARNTVLGSEIVANLAASDYKWPQNQQLEENKFIVQEAHNGDLGGGWPETDTAITLSARDHKGTNTVAVESFTGSSHAQYTDGVGTLRANGGDLGGGSETLIAFSHTQGLSAQTSESAWPTLRNEGGGHAVKTDTTVRRLTPLECERLMGWPDNWTDGQADSHRYKQCGNGVASPVAEWIGHQLHHLNP